MYKIGNLELAYEPHIMFTSDETFLMAREPVFRRMPDGSLLAVIYTGGPFEPHIENVVAVIRSTDDGASWSKPEVLFKHPFRACWGSELFTECENPFIVFQTFDPSSYYREITSFISCTRDSGKTWSEPETFHGISSHFSCRQGRKLSDGSIIFPVYWQEICRNWNYAGGDSIEPFACGTVRSTDAGKTWKLHGNSSFDPEYRLWEPDLIETAPGKLRMFMRCDEAPEHCLWESESSDYGCTWSKPVPGPISNPGTKFTFMKVRDKWVCFNNPVEGDSPSSRHLLEMLVSDDGKHWQKKAELARADLSTFGNSNDFWQKKDNAFRQITYPHGFADDRMGYVYLALDCIYKFFMIKIPFSDILD